MNLEDKAGMERWDDTWAQVPRMRLPQAWISSIRDKMSLRSAVRPGVTARAPGGIRFHRRMEQRAQCNG